WLAFKIENDKIFSGVEDLTEMIIAVIANLRRDRAAIEDALFARENFLFGVENLARLRAKIFREIVDLAFEHLGRAPQQGAHRLKDGTLRHGAERFRRESAIVLCGRERKMQLTGALA